MTGCSSKDNPACNEALIPTITANTQVVAGTSLNLSVSGIDNVAMYNWHGPNGFSSHEESPVVTNMSAAKAGRYTVDVFTVDGCLHTAVTDSVIVSGAVAGCTLVNNRIELNGVNTLNFGVIYGSPGGGSYFVSGNSSGGDFEMEFSGTARPSTGVYSIQPLGGLWGNGYVRLRITSASSLWYPGSGSINVSVVNSKPVISFCNVEFTSATFGFKVKGSGQVTLP